VVNFPDLIALFFFILGAIAGSFLNVVIIRFGTGRTPSGRSHCLSCGKTLGVIDLIPILSFLALRGRCRSCGSLISIQYPIVEAATGLFFLLTYFKFEGSFQILSLFDCLKVALALFIEMVLIVIAGYDIRHKIIPDSLVYIFIISGLVIAFSRFMVGIQFGFDVFLLLDLLSGPLLFLFFYILWKISGGRWMGLGDAKLSLGIGLALGFLSGLSAIIFGFWIGAVVGILLIVFSKLLPPLRLKGSSIAVTMKTEIPFAPFLILGAAIAFFSGLNAFFIF
jgi:leader peptidase (prepilin peptidase)/N-methyltransferase